MTTQKARVKILVIDDEIQMRALLKDLFEEEGFFVDTAIDGSEGIDKYIKNQHDVVITDIIMPEREGISTILELRKRNDKLKIIAMSGFNTGYHKNNLRVAKILGSKETIKKPFANHEIVTMVNSIL